MQADNSLVLETMELLMCSLEEFVQCARYHSSIEDMISSDRYAMILGGLPVCWGTTEYAKYLELVYLQTCLSCGLSICDCVQIFSDDTQELMHNARFAMIIFVNECKK